jgi:hypothetical protein
VHGIRLVELHRVRRGGGIEPLYSRLTHEHSRSLPIPVRMSSGAPSKRSCPQTFKIKVIGKWLKANGANASIPGH